MAKKEETFFEAVDRLAQKRKALKNIKDKIIKDPAKYSEKIKSVIKNFDPEKDKPEDKPEEKEKQKDKPEEKEKQKKKGLRGKYKGKAGGGGGGGGSGISFKDFLERGMPGKRKMRRGGKVSMKRGGLVHGNASKRADGIAKRGKTRGRRI